MRNKKIVAFVGLASLLASCSLDFGASHSFSFAKPVTSISLIDQDELESRSREESLSRENDPGIDWTEELMVSNLKKSDLTCKTASKGKSGTNYEQVSSKLSAKQVADGIGDHVLAGTGERKILVIPVAIKDYKDRATEENRELIYNTFFGKTSDTAWESVSSYYYKSSFGNLLLNGTVSEWFDYGKTTSEIARLTSESVYGSNIGNFDPTLDVLDKAVEWYKKRYRTDCKEFDSDNDGRIDGVWLVYSAPTYQEVNTLSSQFWAYTFSKYNGTANDESPNPFRYCWGSLSSLTNRAYGANQCDAHTYIHETGHMMGLDDYYDTNGRTSSCGGVDMMDNNVADHNCFSKYGLGWVKPYLVSGSCEITLNPAATTGESIILPTENGFNGSAFDEYILMELYTPEELNAKDAANNSYYGPYLKAFTTPGVRIYHIDARMATAKLRLNQWGGWTYTDTFTQTYTQITTRAHTNTPSSGGYSSTNKLNPDYRLIHMIDREGRNFSTSMRFASNNTLFKAGDTFSLSQFSSQFPEKTKMNDGSNLAYSVSFSDLSASGVKVTITKG